MSLARPARFEVVEPDEAPLVLTPAELRQLRHFYDDLVDLHRAEVVEDELFDDAHRLMREHIRPLRAILKGSESVIVDPKAPITF
jgi:hypothetical protein